MKKVFYLFTTIIILFACASTPTESTTTPTSGVAKDSLAVRIWKPEDNNRKTIYRMYNYKNKGIYLLGFHGTYHDMLYMSYPELEVQELNLQDPHGGKLEIYETTFDGEKIYMTTASNHVYIFDCATETFEDITPDSSLVFKGVNRDIYTHDTADFIYKEYEKSDARFQGIALYNGSVVVGEYDPVVRYTKSNNDHRGIDFSRVWSYDGTKWTPLDSNWLHLDRWNSYPVIGNINSSENMIFVSCQSGGQGLVYWDGTQWSLIDGTNGDHGWEDKYANEPHTSGYEFNSLNGKIYVSSSAPYTLDPKTLQWEVSDNVVWWRYEKTGFYKAMYWPGDCFHPFKGYMLYGLYFFNENDQMWHSILEKEANQDTDTAYGDNNLAYDELSSRVAMANIGDTLFISVGDHYPTKYQDLEGIYMLDTKKTAWYKEHFGEK